MFLWPPHNRNDSRACLRLRSKEDFEAVSINIKRKGPTHTCSQLQTPDLEVFPRSREKTCVLDLVNFPMGGGGGGGGFQNNAKGILRYKTV